MKASCLKFYQIKPTSLKLLEPEHQCLNASCKKHTFTSKNRTKDLLRSAQAGSRTPASLDSSGCSEWSGCGRWAREGREEKRESGRLYVRFRRDDRRTHFLLMLEDVLAERPSAFQFLLVPGFPVLTFGFNHLLRQLRILLPLQWININILISYWRHVLFFFN